MSLAETSYTTAAEPDSLAAAAEWLRAAPRRVANLAGEELIEAVARIDDAYDQYPELESAIPRQALADELRAAIGQSGGEAALPAQMACVALDPVPAAQSVTALLDALVRAGHGATSAQIVAILARRRAIASDEIVSAVTELCRQGQLSAALAMAAEASGGGELAVTVLRAGLQRLLCAGDDTTTDPSWLARTTLSARQRVRRSLRPAMWRGAPGSSARLLELAERVAAKLPRQPLSLPRIAATPRRTGRLGFAEFAAQWPEICDVAIEWLPSMRVGPAGEPRPAGIVAGAGHAGHLVYGPYVELGAGDYRVRVVWSAGRPTRQVPRGQPVAAIEVVSRHGKTYLAQHRLGAQDCVRSEHEVLFHIVGRPPPAFPVEVRVWTSGAVPLILSSITVERIAAPARLATTL
jgi:hypothetical protein